jgi:hypothetical protein
VGIDRLYLRLEAALMRSLKVEITRLPVDDAYHVAVAERHPDGYASVYLRVEAEELERDTMQQLAEAIGALVLYHAADQVQVGVAELPGADVALELARVDGIPGL